MTALEQIQAEIANFHNITLLHFTNKLNHLLPKEQTDIEININIKQELIETNSYSDNKEELLWQPTTQITAPELS